MVEFSAEPSPRIMWAEPNEGSVTGAAHSLSRVTALFLMTASVGLLLDLSAI